jgi:hypothetical protein
VAVETVFCTNAVFSAAGTQHVETASVARNDGVLDDDASAQRTLKVHAVLREVTVRTLANRRSSASDDGDPIQSGTKALDVEALQKDFVGRSYADDHAIRA